MGFAFSRLDLRGPATTSVCPCAPHLWPPSHSPKSVKPLGCRRSWHHVMDAILACFLHVPFVPNLGFSLPPRGLCPHTRGFLLIPSNLSLPFLSSYHQFPLSPAPSWCHFHTSVPGHLLLIYCTMFSHRLWCRGSQPFYTCHGHTEPLEQIPQMPQTPAE